MLRSIIRILSFFTQWLAEVIRQPLLIASLILGPFVILLLFGFGEQLSAPRPRTVVVTSATQAQDDPLGVTMQDLRQYLTIVGTTPNERQARDELVAGQADVVLILPSDPAQAVAQGKHVPITVLTNIIDPISLSYADVYLRQQVSALNQQTVQKAIAQMQTSVGDVHGFVTQAQQLLAQVDTARGTAAQASDSLTRMKTALDPLAASIDQLAGQLRQSPLASTPFLAQPVANLLVLAGDVDSLKKEVDRLNGELAGATNGTTIPTADEVKQMQASLVDIDNAAAGLRAIPPDVLSAPFTLKIDNVAPFVPSALGYYSPAVLALLLQHLAITLSALSMSRVRLLGLVELFQTSPVRPIEIALGKYLSYGVLCVVAGAALLALLIGGLGVPLYGAPEDLAGTLLLLTACSLGIGFLISLISSSEQQAVQLAMLVLIASVFFSGFLVTLDTIVWPVRIVSYLLPATYAIRTLQDVMLRGVLRTPQDLQVLGAASAVLFALTVLLLRRELRPR